MSATDINDGLLSSLSNGMNQAMQDIIDRRALERAMNHENNAAMVGAYAENAEAWKQRSQEWEVYAKSLEKKNEDLNGKVKKQEKKIESHITYMNDLKVRIRELDEKIQTQSANSHAYSLLRKELTSEIEKVSNDETLRDFASIENQRIKFEAYYKDFMVNYNVRIGPPMPRK